ncbi:MAG TPA: tetratricopeptide repeat protein, partial [Turneriella sp.]|nr:tetratricopeptide repeat protein [Turneriella sp.]
MVKHVDIQERTMRIFISIVCTFGLLTPSISAEVYPLQLFRSYGDVTPQAALLIGKINTKGTDNSIPPEQILGYDARMAVVSASIDNAAKVYPGMKVYIVKRERNHTENRAALIVAEGEIDAITNTVFQGRVARIRGQFSMVSRQHFIAIPQNATNRDGNTRSAHEYLLEAERYRHERDLARAAQMLEHARALEPTNPLVELRYAELALTNDAHEKAHRALAQAFRERRRLENVNDYLKLGALYLTLEMNAMPSLNQEILKKGTSLLMQMRAFEKDLGQYGRDLTPPKSRRMRVKQTHFSAVYHYQYGRLLNMLAITLREYSPESIT